MLKQKEESVVSDHKPAETSLGNTIHPIAIHGETLTDKDFTCIAQHLQEYQREIIGREINVPNACETCRYEAQCFNTGVSTDWLKTFIKVANITGVNCINHAEDAASMSRNTHLTYDDFRCIALHLNYLIETSFRRETNEAAPFPCQVCDGENMKCYKDYRFFLILEKLGRLSSVSISKGHAAKVLVKYQEHLHY